MPPVAGRFSLAVRPPRPRGRAAVLFREPPPLRSASFLRFPAKALSLETSLAWPPEVQWKLTLESRVLPRLLDRVESLLCTSTPPMTSVPEPAPRWCQKISLSNRKLTSSRPAKGPGLPQLDGHARPRTGLRACAHSQRVHWLSPPLLWRVRSPTTSALGLESRARRSHRGEVRKGVQQRTSF